MYTERFQRHHKPMIPRILELIDDGYTQAEIAKILTDDGFRSERGGPVSQSSVSRCVHLAKALNANKPATAVEAEMAKNSDETADFPLFDDRRSTPELREVAEALRITQRILEGTPEAPPQSGVADFWEWKCCNFAI